MFSFPLVAQIPNGIYKCSSNEFIGVNGDSICIFYGLPGSFYYGTFETEMNQIQLKENLWARKNYIMEMTPCDSGTIKFEMYPICIEYIYDCPIVYHKKYTSIVGLYGNEKIVFSDSDGTIELGKDTLLDYDGVFNLLLLDRYGSSFKAYLEIPLTFGIKYTIKEVMNFMPILSNKEDENNYDKVTIYYDPKSKAIIKRRGLDNTHEQVFSFEKDCRFCIDELKSQYSCF